jgi:alkylation response protein AidB-like acyl-CoA dehydrogenase
VRLTLDEDQRDLVSTARQLVARRYGMSEKDGVMAPRHEVRTLLADTAELGWTGLGLPEEAGGAGGTLVELALVVEELGRGGLPAPMAASTGLVALPLAEAGVRGDLVEQIASGAALATMPLLAAGAGDEWSAAPPRAERTDAGWRLDAGYTLVPFGAEADLFLVRVDLEGRGDSLLVLPAATADTRAQRVVGGDPRAAVSWSGAAVAADQVLDVSPDAVPGIVSRAVDTAAVLAAAHAVGSCEAALQLSVTWARDRQQFGRQIGSFQTVSNRCADMRLGTDAARLLVWEASWSLAEHRPDAPELVSVAKAYLNEVADTVVVNAHQVHAAMGFSTEYPLHVFTRALKAFRGGYGTSDAHLDRVADAIGLAASSR